MGLLDRFSGPPTEDKFAKIMGDALRSAGDTREWSYDKAEFRLLFTKDGKEAGMTNLRNLFAEYCRSPKNERNAWLARTCKGLLNWMDIPDDFEDVKPDLLPTVRTRSMLEVLRLDAEIGGDKPADLPSLPLTEHLIVCLVYDLPNSMKFVTQESLDKWGVTLYEAAEVARRNLEERPFTMMSVNENLFVVESGDAYDGTRLLLIEQIRQLPLTGQPVVMPVSRDCLLIAGSDDIAGLTLMASLAEKQSGEARPLCPIPMLLTGDEWGKWPLPLDHPLFGNFKELELKYYYGEYTDQKKLLEKLHEKTGKDIFVATFSAVERDKKLLSYAVWSKTVSTWLPKTDFVGLFDSEADTHNFVPWEQLQAVVGGMMEPLDFYPPRWFVNDFPTVEQIERMQPENWSKES